MHVHVHLVNTQLIFMLSTGHHAKYMLIRRTEVGLEKHKNELLSV